MNLLRFILINAKNNFDPGFDLFSLKKQVLYSLCYDLLPVNDDFKDQ